MKKILFLPMALLLMLVMTACDFGGGEQDEMVEMEGKETEMNEMDMDDESHIGCQEGEIDEDGNCVTAEEGDNNAALFEMDFTGKVVTEAVQLENVSGFFARPAEAGDYPGVVMIHEWWGLNENIEYMAQLLANEGYNVFAVDLYNGVVAEESSQAGELAGSVRSNPEQAVEKMKEAVAYLREEQSSARIASLGWCFGGQQSLNLSLAEDLDATVIYYGQLRESAEELASVSGPVLGIFGEEDSSISLDSVENFQEALEELGVENTVNVYDGVGHAFANPSGSNYAPEETIDAWETTLEFLAGSLKE